MFITVLVRAMAAAGTACITGAVEDVVEQQDRALLGREALEQHQHRQ
jgi:hypothetical protein